MALPTSKTVGQTAVETEITTSLDNALSAIDRMQKALAREKKALEQGQWHVSSNTLLEEAARYNKSRAEIEKITVIADATQTYSTKDSFLIIKEKAETFPSRRPTE